MSGIVFDTSIYISAFRQGDTSILDLRRASQMSGGGSYPLWLSAVVLLELLVGTSDAKSRKLLRETEREFTKMDRMLIPIQSDWSLAGQVLARVGERHGYEQVGRARMTNDALIAMTAARHGFIVLTKNGSDFQKIAEFRSFHWQEV